MFKALLLFLSFCTTALIATEINTDHQPCQGLLVDGEAVMTQAQADNETDDANSVQEEELAVMNSIEKILGASPTPLNPEEEEILRNQLASFVDLDYAAMADLEDLSELED